MVVLADCGVPLWSPPWQTPSAMDETPLVLPAGDVSFLILLATFLPGVVTLLTKTHAPDWVKNIINLLLSALVVSLDQVFRQDGGLEDFSWSAFGASLALTFAASVLAYQKIWKDSPVHAWVAAASKRVGLGGPPRVPVNNDATVMVPVVVDSSVPVAVEAAQVPVVVAAEEGVSAGSSSGAGGVVGEPQGFNTKLGDVLEDIAQAQTPRITTTGPVDPAPGAPPAV